MKIVLFLLSIFFNLNLISAPCVEIAGDSFPPRSARVPKPEQIEAARISHPATPTSFFGFLGLWKHSNPEPAPFKTDSNGRAYTGMSLEELAGEYVKDLSSKPFESTKKKSNCSKHKQKTNRKKPSHRK